MFVFFETKSYSRGLIFAVSSGLVTYLGTHAFIMFASTSAAFIKFEI